MLSQNGDILSRKLHSMRETPPILKNKKKTTRYTFHQNSLIKRVNTSLNQPQMYPYHVTMSLTWGQYARFFTLFQLSHKRPVFSVCNWNEGRYDFGHNVKRFFYDASIAKKVDNSNCETFLTSKKASVKNLQRLNVEKHSKEWYEHWLVGLTDGDGTFSVDPHFKPNGHIVWNLVFKISLNKYNIRALLKAKSFLGAGILNETPDNTVSLRIRNREHLKKFVFPVFDKIPLVSNKYYDYQKIRRISTLLDDNSLSPPQRLQQIQEIFSQKSSREEMSPVWSQHLSQETLETYKKTGQVNLNKPEIEKVLSLPWILGFIEAEGSFYILRKERYVNKPDRYCHAFGLTQAGNGFLMEALRCYFKIVACVQLKKPASFQNHQKGLRSYFQLETTNWRCLQSIRNLCFENLLGIKSLEFRIWERSMKDRENSEKLVKIQKKLRNLREKFKRPVNYQCKKKKN